jgi:hypothetical protein
MFIITRKSHTIMDTLCSSLPCLWKHLKKVFYATPPLRPLVVSNIAEGTHAGLVTRRADSALSQAFTLVQTGSDEAHVAACDASAIPLGVIEDEAPAAEDPLTVALLGSAASTLVVRAGASITAGDFLVSDASGEARTLPATAGTYYIFGRAIRNAASGELCEFDPCVPVQRIV